jgi:uncharacterized protein with WD repeat
MRKEFLAKTGRLLHKFLTSTTNLIHLQNKLRSVVKENCEFRSTRNETRIIVRVMADFQSIKSHFDTNNLSYYSFYPKSEKLTKAAIHHLPQNSPAERHLTGR